MYIYEEEYPFSERVLIVHGNEYALKGRDCEDVELKKFSDELWTEIEKQNDLSKIKSGTISLLKQQKEAVPENCRYVYKRSENGEWTKN